MDSYKEGFVDGLTAFAINREGEQWIGSPERRLREVIAFGVERIWNYCPPAERSVRGMSPDEIVDAARAMQIFGGSFAQAIGTALERADSINQRRILGAFGDLISEYGYGSRFYPRKTEPDRSER